MAEIIAMPKLSDTMEEGGIANWLKKEGEFIEEGEAFVEIETDKATMEYNSPAEGHLLKILVPAGKTCDLNTPICVVGEKGEKFDLDELTGGKAKKTAPKKEEPKAEREKAAAAAKPAAAATTPATQPNAGRLRASPLAKKMAKDQGKDLSQIQGSGPGGRVVARDIETFVQRAPAAAAAGGVMVSGGADKLIPVSMMRKTIGKRLHAAKNDAPHFYLTVSANMNRLGEWRKRLNDEAEKANGALPKVSVNDLIVLACAKALRRHPMVNASWEETQICQFGSVHLAVAVALPEGLITPVIRNTDQLGVRDIAAQSKELIRRAKEGSLKPEEYQGGTFSISNLGMMGIEHFTAIINPPQAAIIAVGATIPTPWVNDKGEVVVQPRMKMTMSCDHRVIDGALGASFLQTLVGYLEDPLMMLS